MNIYNYLLIVSKKISLFIGILIYTSKVLKTNRAFKLKFSHPPVAHLGALLPPAISSAPVYHTIITDKETNTKRITG